MIYIDTSALVPMFFREPKTESIIDWLEASENRLAVSDWTLVEFASAAAIKVRTAQATPTLAKRARQRVVEFVRDYCNLAIPGREQYQHAAELAGTASLRVRAGDALHLAIAKHLKARAILCFDEGLAESARAIGINALSL